LLYPEAVYVHQGQTHFVERLDTLNKVAYVRREEMDYYTQAILESLIQVKGTEREKPWGVLDSPPPPADPASANSAGEPAPSAPSACTRVCFGEVAVTWATVGFKKIQFYSMDSLGWGALSLPPQTLTTTGVWLVPSPNVGGRVRAAGRNPV